MSAYAGSSDQLFSRETARQMFHRELELDPWMFGVPLGEVLAMEIIAAFNGANSR
jgi:hypothetical protein